MKTDKHTYPVYLHARKAAEGHVFITASVQDSMDAARSAEYVYVHIAHQLQIKGLEIVQERIFGSLSVAQEILTGRTKMLHFHGISSDNPFTYIQGNPPWGEGLAGVLIHAIASKGHHDDVWTIMDDDVPCGKGWKQNGQTYMIIQNIHAPLNTMQSVDTKEEQARLMFERAAFILHNYGATYKDVLRTWIYLSDILDWYASFNQVRNKTYEEFGLMPDPGDRRLLLPASTGIQGEPLSGAACTMDLISVSGANGNLAHIQKMTNPSQLDAFMYGSAFARASIIKNNSSNIVEISGTAAINKHGVSLYPGDIRAQIDCTFDNVQSLLEQEGIGLKEICSATVFIKRPKDAEIFYEMAVQRELEDLPSVLIVADICREELLFEIDAEAAVHKEQD
jgi:enamine deaminase RidA (YjgF/YER057c/UK114 family)